MKGLLLKEILVMKPYWKLYGGLAVFYAVIAFMGNSSMFSCMIAAFMLILPLSSFTADEQARWDKFAVSLPGGRRAVVREKYQLLFLSVAVAAVLSLVIGALLVLTKRGELFELAVSSLIYLGIGLLINVILYPFIFKFGSQTSRLIMGIVIGVSFAAAGFISVAVLGGWFRLPLPALPYLSPVVIAAAAVVLLTVVLAVSYRVSCRIYDKKEF